MKSPVLKHFGGPFELRQAMKTEIVERLQGHPTSTELFPSSRKRATDSEIRALRPKGKRRNRIYNYERERAEHIWHDTIYVAAEGCNLPLAEYASYGKVMKINTYHHLVLVKVLQSVVASHGPEIKIVLAQWGRPPRYTWNSERTQEPEPEQDVYGSVSRTARAMQAYMQEQMIQVRPPMEWGYGTRLDPRMPRVIFDEYYVEANND